MIILSNQTFDVKKFSLMHKINNKRNANFPYSKKNCAKKFCPRYKFNH